MKLLLSAVLSAAVCYVSPFAVSQEVTGDSVMVAADCNCAPAPCCETSCCRPKKFHKVEYQKEVCRIRRVTVIDECGCEKKKCMKVTECVTRTKIERVDPCAPTCLDKIKGRLNCACDKLKAKCNSRKCCDPCDCGCATPADCSCGAASADIMMPTIIEADQVIDQPVPAENQQ